MNLRKKMTIEQYASLKENAYCFAKTLDKEQLINFIENLNISNQEEALIYLSTLMYPNDKEIISEFTQGCNLTKISQKLNIPETILNIKAQECASYKLNHILKNNKVLNDLASQQSKFTNDDANYISSMLK